MRETTMAIASTVLASRVSNVVEAQNAETRASASALSSIEKGCPTMDRLRLTCRSAWLTGD